MEIDKQKNIWDHYQNNEANIFDINNVRLNHLFEKIIKSNLNGAKILNIGAGSGYLERKLKDAGKDIYSLDLSPTTVESLKKNNIKAFHGSAAKMYFENNYFDFVVASEVLEHIPDSERTTVIKEIHRVLKNGGFFIGTVPFEEVLSNSIVFCPHCQKSFHRWGHVTSFTIEKIKIELNAFFKISKIYTSPFADFKNKKLINLIKESLRYILGLFRSKLIDQNIVFEVKKT